MNTNTALLIRNLGLTSFLSAIHSGGRISTRTPRSIGVTRLKEASDRDWPGTNTENDNQINSTDN